MPRLVAFLLAFVLPRFAWAAVRVSIHHDSEEQLELARRIASELTSEGYAVEIRDARAAPPPCDPSAARLVPVAPEGEAWIVLRTAASESDTIVASICYLGAMPFLQQASPSAPRSDPRQLALATAEALNGLRSKLPPLVGDTGPVTTHKEEPPPSFVNTITLGPALMLTLPDFPPAPGVAARATLGAAPAVGIMMDAFVPTTGRELSSSQVTATIRTAWLRLGPRVGWALGDFDVSAAALVGPALTWVTAVARPPRIGTADVSPGAVFSLAALVEYPRDSPVFACGSASASLLVPGARVKLGDDPFVPRGSWPIDFSIGLGARWGGDR